MCVFGTFFFANTQQKEEKKKGQSLKKNILKSMFSSINGYETWHRARVGDFCFVYDICVQSEIV